MRLLIIAILLAFAATAFVSVGQAQTDDSQVAANPPSGSAQRTYSEDNFWPNAAQENAIPYRACKANVIINGHLECLNK
jgi:hypothetical protein